MIEPRNYNYTCSTMVNHQKRFIVDDVEILINDIETFMVDMMLMYPIR